MAGFPPKSSIWIGFSIIFTIHFGVPQILGNPHIWKKGFEHARKCPSKVITKKFQDRIKKAERSDFFCKPLAQLWHYGTWIFPTCFNTITNPEFEMTMSWYLIVLQFPDSYALWRVAIMLQKGLVCGILSLPIRSLRLAVFFRRRTASFGQPDLLWSDRIILKWTLWHQQKNHPDFPFLLGTISMHQWMKCTPPHEN